MSKTFATMKTNIGNMVQDTSTGFATLIANWINDKYLDISRRCLWSALIDFDYTDATEVGIATYDLPADFDQEIYVADITVGTPLVRYTENFWFSERSRDYSSGTLLQGSPEKYIILKSENHLFLDPTPNVIHTIAMPYKKSITALANPTDVTLIKDIEVAIELGATSEAMAYKRQFQKASYYLQRYEVELQRRVDQERSNINQIYRSTYARQGLANSRLTGDLSYDSL